MLNPEFQLVAWTIKFYLQVETRLATPTKGPAAKGVRTAASSAGERPRRRGVS